MRCFLNLRYKFVIYYIFLWYIVLLQTIKI